MVKGYSLRAAAGWTTPVVGLLAVASSLALDASGQIGHTSGLDAELEGLAHAGGIDCLCDCGIDEDSFRANFHGLRCFGRDSKSGVHDHGDRRLFDDDHDLLEGEDALSRPDGRTQWHDRRAADVLQTHRENGVGVDVGKDDETVVDEYLCRFIRADGVGEEPLALGNDLQFHPV